MHNDFACDVGDFGKYALLRCLASNDFRLGVIWYLSGGGRTFDYLEEKSKPEFRQICPDLYDALLQIHQKRVDLIKAIESSEVLPGKSVFFNEPVAAGIGRDEWFNRALEKTNEVDIVFCDPDNGLAPKDADKRNKPSTKHALISEVKKLVSRQQSVVLYQFLNRSSEHGTQVCEVSRRLREVAGENKICVVTCRRIVVHTYFIILAKDHCEELGKRLHRFANGSRRRKDVLRLELQEGYF